MYDYVAYSYINFPQNNKCNKCTIPLLQIISSCHFRKRNTGYLDSLDRNKQIKEVICC
jgi:hypothetical protein